MNHWYETFWSTLTTPCQVPCTLLQNFVTAGLIYLNKVIIWAIQLSVQLNDKTLEVRRKFSFLSWAIRFWGLSL